MAKKVTAVIVAILVALFMVGAANAASTLTLDNLTKPVDIGGTVDFTVTLDTDYSGVGTLVWESYEDPITAKIGTEALAQSGHVDVDTPPGHQVFTLTLAAGAGAIVGHEYTVGLYYCGAGGCTTMRTIKAKAEAGAIPTPELSTSILTATGLIGLIGLVRYRRKD